ncbi:MAG: Ig domain-containing protein [Planctomycetes bacterium]|nr:Ig domain-containing protein [Planctomycetota bacterium]
MNSRRSKWPVLFALMFAVLASCSDRKEKPLAPLTYLPEATVGVFYDEPLGSLEAEKQTGSNFTPIGEPPPGMSVDGGRGYLTGTPTTAGTYNFKVERTDPSGGGASADFSIKVS